MTISEGYLSNRAALSCLPALPYFAAFMDACADHWSPDNPDGHIALAVAENRLSSELVQQALQRHSSSFPVDAMYYQDMRGIAELRIAIARMLTSTFMQGVFVDPDHITVLTGCGAVVDLLSHLMADAGQGVLIPAPYYPAFDNDLKVRSELVPVPVQLDYSCADLSPALGAAAAAAAAAGHPIRVLLLTHPTNPQGTLYSRQQLASCIQWCLLNKVHCISDEVYANSVFDESAEFVSAAAVVAEDVPGMEGAELAADLVHVMFGFSKDFGASGVRVGCVYTANSAINKALSNVSYFASVGVPSQWVLATLVSDKAWLQHFLQENKKRLREVYHTLTSGLDAAGIPYVPAQASMFLWVDLSAAINSSGSSSDDDSTSASGDSSAADAAINETHGSSSSSSAGSSSGNDWDAEARFWEYMARQHKVVLTPGSACHAAAPGWFRICYAWPPADCIPTAVERIVAAVKGFQMHQQQQQ